MCVNSESFYYVNHVTVICLVITLTSLHISFTFCREVPAEPLQADDTGPTINPDKLTDLQESELLEERRHSGTEEDLEILERLHEDPTGQTEEPEMCEDVDENVDPEQSVAVPDNEEPSTQAADNAERIENSQEILEQTEKRAETSCLQHRDCDQMTSQDVELSPRPECSEPEQLETTEEPEQVQAEERHSEDSDQLEQSQHLEQSPQMETIEESNQPENADLPEEESTQSEQTVCAEAEDPGVAEQREQMEPLEQNEQMTVFELLVQPEKTDESEMTEQTEVAQQTAEAELNQVDKRAEEVGGGEDGSVQTVVANGEQPKPPETAAPHMNGGDVEREMAHRLAERLYKLDGIQRVDVVKHLDKE